MQAPDKSASLLNPIGYRNNSCGYCHNKSGSFSYYASTTSLQPDFYQSLLDRGWRRSGTLLYKPDQKASCCPHYTIRLDSEAFHASKDQRQALNRFNNHIIGETYIKVAVRLYPKSREQAKQRNTEFNLLERVHESESANLKTPPEPAHSLTVSLEPDNFTEEKYSLFENYQRIVHQEPPQRISKHGFRNFLCSSPLPRRKEIFDGRERRLGSYHQCYRIDGKLVALGVLDLLPQCVSAVYFIYHDSVHQHGFGKLGALREIALAKEEGYKWWYSGFYIHSCVKMRYKGDYSPQYILDPESYSWDPFDEEMKKLLDSEKFVSLSQRRQGNNRSNGNDVTPVADSMDTDTLDGDVDGEDDDSDYEPPVPFPDLPLFARSMPGVLSKQQLLTDIDLNQVTLRIRGQEAEACDLMSWDLNNIDDPNSIPGIIADLVAAVGVDLGNNMAVTFN